MASRTETTPNYINTQVFITISSSIRLNGQTEPTNGNFDTTENFAATYGSKLIDISIKRTKYKPPRAHKLIKFDLKTIDKEDGLKFDQSRSKSWNFGSPTTHPQSPGLKFHFHHQFVKNPMILCNTPLWFVVEHKLESLAANGPQMRAAIDVVPPPRKIGMLKKVKISPGIFWV